jgi:hypothetical protein
VVGITDRGELKGLTGKELTTLNQMISNVCSQKIDPNIIEAWVPGLAELLKVARKRRSKWI